MKTVFTTRAAWFCGISALLAGGSLAAPASAQARGAGDGAAESPLRFTVSFPAELSAEPQDGRLLLMLSRDSEGEPRFGVSDGPNTALLFGINVDGWQPGEEAVFTDTVFGYPLHSIAEIPPGTYRAQAFLNRYETFTRSDGHTIKLPPDRGEGQVWNRKPGNFYSTPIEVRIDPSSDRTVQLTLNQEIPPLPEPTETEWIKHIRIRSDLLSDFWGRDMYLGAWVLLPAGFDEHPDARYPIAIFHGHFPAEFGGWQTTPPDTTEPCEYSERFQLECYNRIQQEQAYQLYQDWTGPDFPRMLVVELQHANPYYDDSYAVNSANLGPYGDAITHELIPAIEERFRGIGEGWARFLYGGSTGGWEAMGVQVLYPDDYNGAWIACPDPIDFRAYTVVNLYEDQNAYHLDGDPNETPRPGRRDWLGHVQSTLREMNHKELVLGTNSRSGDQWDIWQAVYGPVGPDGYPKPIWDKMTGEIDRSVADYWRENYDLVHILQRDWNNGLGEKLEGKLHIYVGDMDNYYLNNAVYLAEDFLESTTDPYYAGEVDYGDRAEHCWNGDQTMPNAISRLRYIQMFAPKIAERIRQSAPEGADTTSWKY